MLVWISFLISASNSLGDKGIGSMPCAANFSTTLGFFSAFSVSERSRSTMAGGVFAGANSPIQ